MGKSLNCVLTRMRRVFTPPLSCAIASTSKRRNAFLQTHMENLQIHVGRCHPAHTGPFGKERLWGKSAIFYIDKKAARWHNKTTPCELGGLKKIYINAGHPARDYFPSEHGVWIEIHKRRTASKKFLSQPARGSQQGTKAVFSIDKNTAKRYNEATVCRYEFAVKVGIVAPAQNYSFFRQKYFFLKCFCLFLYIQFEILKRRYQDAKGKTRNYVFVTPEG